MIVDKKNGQIVPEGQTSAPEPDAYEVKEIAQMPSNGIIDVFKAVKQILREVRWEYGNPKSPIIFNTVQRNDGQFERIIKREVNKEDTLAFPAVFIHFVNIHWLKPSGRIREGRGELRIKFIMNRLNVHDNDDTETEIDYVAQRIKQDFEEKRYNYECLSERLSLDYYDPIQTFDNSLQACWMNWEVWFRETSIWVTRNKIRKHLVIPPFTNHADQDPSISNINPKDHNNLDHPIRYDDVTSIEYNGIIDDAEPEEPELEENEQ